MLSHREGLVMYWCEGDRSEESRTYRVALTSSDVMTLKFFIRWYYYDVKRDRIKLRLHLWSDTNEKLANEFWYTNLGIHQRNFTKPQIKPKGRGKRSPLRYLQSVHLLKKLLRKILADIDKEFISQR
jgi:hypothetical protein